MKKIILSIHILFAFNVLIAQTDTTKLFNLDEVVIVANNMEQSKRKIPQQVYSLSSKQIGLMNTQNSGDLLSATGLVMVQKSQQGGSSPILRGFEASRVLLVVDGVRMNNLVYRAGHLQNVITIDQNMLEKVEVLFGPASTVYGSDALGGVIHFRTKNPVVSESDKILTIGNAFTRYSSVNNEKTGHFNLNVGSKRLAVLISGNYSDFGDLRMGKKAQTLDTVWGLRKYYAQRSRNSDELTTNPDVYVQKFSGYTQYDGMVKVLFKPNNHITHLLNTQFSSSTDVPRYDRLTDPKGNGLNQAEWYYGPQKRFMSIYTLKMNNEAQFFQNIQANVSYQNIEESRHTRSFGNDRRTSRIEKVDVLGASIDFQRKASEHELRTGVDIQWSGVNSTAFLKNLRLDTIGAASTRYPDGDNSMLNIATYLTHTFKFAEQLTMSEGLRIGLTNLKSTFVSQQFYKFPFQETKQNNGIYSGNLGLIYSPTNDLKISVLASSGFRVPNVDDLAKVFDTQRGNVVVPNPDLKPEKTWNYEVGLAKNFNNILSFEGNVYFTRFRDAIVVDKFTYNGQDSITYDGVKSVVFAPQNKQKANLWGYSATIKAHLLEGLVLTVSYNYTKGRVKESDGKETPLDHIPPAFGRVGLQYIENKFNAELFSNFSGWKRLADYRLKAEDNEAYATKDGMPSWWTINFRTSYMLTDNFTLQVGIDNIADINYRVFASGIHAGGRNVWGTVRVNF